MSDDITRRDFLAGVAATVGAAPLAHGQQRPAPPRHPPSTSSPSPSPPPSDGGPGGGPSNKSLLGQDDFKYAGLFTLPGGVRLGFSNGAIAGRRVNGEVRLFVAGGYPSGDPVIEVAYPGQGRDALQAPRARLVRNWGDVYESKRVTGTGGGRMTRGLLWANDQLYWAYGDEYNVAGMHDPSIGATALNANGSLTSYGPWRTEEHSQKTRGYMVQLPQWFTAYTEGRAYAVGAPITSGNGSSPWGAMLDAVSFPDSSRTAADRINDGHSSIKCQRLIYHDIERKQKRDTNYKYCGWNVQYDCSKGAFLKPGSPEFNGIDMITAAAWVDLPNKHGVVFFGQLSTKIPGYNYGSGDDVPHYWYGPSKCCHGQDAAPVSESTGDATGSSVPYVWIYDPNDLVRSAQGKVDPWKFDAKVEFPTSSIASVVGQRAGKLYAFGGAYFDAESRSLFLSQVYADSFGGEPQPVIHVFTIA